jgi:hypothetical protein
LLEKISGGTTHGVESKFGIIVILGLTPAREKNMNWTGRIVRQEGKNVKEIQKGAEYYERRIDRAKTQNAIGRLSQHFGIKKRGSPFA